MVRPTDRETIDIEEIVCYRFQKEWAGCAIQNHTRSTRVVSSRGIQGKTWARIFCGFRRKEPVRQGKQA